MQIRCPGCDHSSELPDGFSTPSGSSVTCPSCSTAFAVLPGGFTMAAAPAGGSAAPSAAAPTPSSPFVSLATPATPAPASSPGAPASPELAPGTALGDLVIRRLIGRGGFGAVYEGEDTLRGKPVAVKVAVDPQGRADQLIRQLVAEFDAADALTDRRHVIRTYPPQRHLHANLEWLVLPMELASGSLRGWIDATADDREGRLERGLELLRQACSGVEAMHAAGLVHLDIKPENLLLVGEGDEAVVKVADFGLARGMAAARPELQVDGIGTPAYMAPEQVLAARWKDVGPAADVYGLGMVLYEILDGDLPYGGSGDQIRAKKRDPEVRIARPKGPEHLVELAMRCLEREAAKRPGVAEVADGLDSERQDLDDEFDLDDIRRELGLDSLSDSDQSVEVSEEESHDSGWSSRMASDRDFAISEIKEALSKANLSEHVGCDAHELQDALAHLGECLSTSGFPIDQPLGTYGYGNMVVSACQGGNAAVLRFLIEKGADLEVFRPTDTRRPIDWALSGNLANAGCLECARVLVGRGVDLGAERYLPNDLGSHPIWRLASTLYGTPGGIPDWLQENVGLITTLLNEILSSPMSRSAHRPLLLHAVTYGIVPVMRVLAPHVADLESLSIQGLNPLAYSELRCSQEVASWNQERAETGRAPDRDSIEHWQGAVDFLRDRFR